jgi:two-component system cell cycle response regulator
VTDVVEIAPERAPGAGPAAAGAALRAVLADLETDCRFGVDGIAERARALADAAGELGASDLRLRAELVLADLQRRSGELAAAARTAQRARRWAEDNDARHLLGRSSYVLAAILQELGDLAAALELSVTAVDLIDEAVPATERIDRLVRLADCLGLQRDEAAAARYAEVLPLTQELGDVDRELMVLNNWAYTEALAGRYEAALQICDQLQTRSTAHAVSMDVGRLDTIGRTLLGAGRLEDAIAVLSQGLMPGALEASADGDAGADFLLTVSEAHRRLGSPTEAQRYLDECVRRCDRHGLAAIRNRAREEQAHLHADAGDFRAAYQEQKRFSDALAQLHSAESEARARAMQAVYEVSEARRQSSRYRELSLRDPLTGLYNRRHVDETLPGLLRSGRPVTVALVDLDHFKVVNDTCSHEVGDQVLQRIATLLTRAAESTGASGSSFAARLGGEEFLLVLDQVVPSSALARLDDLRRSIRSAPWTLLTGAVPVTVSIGVAGSLGAEDLLATEVLALADRHLYAAKRRGRDRVVSSSR